MSSVRRPYETPVVVLRVNKLATQYWRTRQTYHFAFEQNRFRRLFVVIEKSVVLYVRLKCNIKNVCDFCVINYVKNRSFLQFRLKHQTSAYFFTSDIFHCYNISFFSNPKNFNSNKTKLLNVCICHS